MEIRALLSSMWRSRVGPLLVAAQVAFTTALIVNLAFVIVGQLGASSRPTGLDLKNMFWLTTQTRSSVYDPAAYGTAVKADLAWLNALPGVVAAATSNPLPQSFAEISLPFTTNPQQLEKISLDLMHLVGTIYQGSDRFVDAMGLRLIAGRNFRPGEVQPPGTGGFSLDTGASEVIVTRALALKNFPDGQALGRTLYMGLGSSIKPVVIVGIVDVFRANPVATQFDEAATRIAIMPVIAAGPNGSYVVRTLPGRRDEVMARVEKELGDLQPGRFVSRIEAYDVTAGRARESYHSSIIILSVITALVLLVTVAGMVGLAAFNVAMRTKQLGIRRAIGARRFHILRYFLIENWLTTTAGVVPGCILGLGAAVALSRVLQSTPLPLYYLAGGALVMWGAGLVAVLMPALRAASTSPATATRTV